MVLAIADRVQETTTTTGTGTVNLDGAKTGFQTFVLGIGDANTCHYCITDGIDWEVGLGTVTDAAPDTLSRDTVIDSSNGGALVSWGAGVRDVFQVLPGDKTRAQQALGVEVGVDAAAQSHVGAGGASHADVVAGGADGFMTGGDKTKLDGIESAATADQTDAEIKTAYEANANTNEFDDAEQSKLAGIEALADVTDAANVNAAGAVMETDFNADTVLAANADNTPLPLTIAVQRIIGRITAGNIKGLTAAEVRTLINVESGSTADQTDAEIKTAYENNANTNEFDDAEQTKLAGIEALADVTDAANVNAAGAVMETDFNADTVLAANADNTPLPLTIAVQRIIGRITAGNIKGLTAAEVRTLINVESGSTADQTDAEIKTAYENNANTNEFDDTEQSKLAGIATGAEVNPDLISQAEAEAGTATTERIFSALRVAQAVAALESITSISNTSITAITNIDVTGFLPGTYDNYEVWLSNGLPANDDVILEMETSTDGGTSFDTGVSDYTWARSRVTEGGAPGDIGDPDDSEIELTENIGFAANEGISTKISVFSPEATEFTNFTWAGTRRNAVGLFVAYYGGADRQSAADVDGLRFHFSAGDWAARGNIQFLGIAQ